MAFPSSTHARRHAGAAAVGVHPTDLRPRPSHGSLVTSTVPRLTSVRSKSAPTRVYLTNERRLAPSSLVVAVSALRFLYRVTLQKRWVFDDMIPAPKKPRSLPVVLSPEEVVQFLDGVKAAKHHAHPDHVLRRRPAHLRGRPPHRVRHRQRTHGAAHREGQGTEGPLRDALAEAAGGPARLVESRTAPALALSRRASRDADHAGSGPACMPDRRPTRAPRQAGFATRAPERFDIVLHLLKEPRFPRGFLLGWDLSGAVGGQRGRLRLPTARRAGRDPGG